jgi:hypothetical protein
MPDLTIEVHSAEAVAFSASPLIALRLNIRNKPANEAIQGVMLQAQVQIETTRRLYDDQEQARLLDLFGEPARWNETLRNMLWTHASATVRPFIGETQADLPIPCTFDFNVAATKYFAGLNTGDVPVFLLFSGTVFYEDSEGLLRISQIPWNTEARFRIPIEIWRRMMDHYYPNSAWLTLRRDVFDRLHEFKRARGIATWDQALEQLLP